MPTCFVCKSIHTSFKLLLRHLTAIHNVHEFSTDYRCVEDSCARSFKTLNSFRKHVERHSNNNPNPGDIPPINGENDQEDTPEYENENRHEAPVPNIVETQQLPAENGIPIDFYSSLSRRPALSHKPSLKW